MGYGNRCPTCLRPLRSIQSGRGASSSFGTLVKRAMAREVGKRMAGMALKLQNVGASRRTQTQQGSGILGSIVRSKPVKAVGKAAVEALAGRAIQALSSPNVKRTPKRTPKRRRVSASETTRKRRKGSRTSKQTGSGLPLVALLAAAAPLIGKTVGLGTLGAVANHGVQKLLGN